MRALLLLLALLTSPAWSADFFWRASTHSTNYPSAVAACDGAIAHKNSTMGVPYDYRYKRLDFTGEASRSCLMDVYVNGSFYNNDSVTLQRFGDVCPAGTTYNATTGACDAPPPNIGEQCGVDAEGKAKFINSQGQCVVGGDLDQAAVCKALASTGTRTKKVYVRFDGDGTPHAPTIADKTGCVAELALSGVDHCKLPAAKSEGGISLVPNGSYCTVFVNYTGEVDNDTGEGYPVGNPEAGEEGVCPNPDQCTAPEPPIVKDSKPCNYMSDGQVVGCESTAFEGNPGEMNCGTVNGGPYTCTRREPTSNGIKIATKIETTPNANGTTTQTKTDTYTQTKCIGANACVTQVSNNKTTVVKDGNGNTLSSNSECTGPACSSGGKGDSNGDGIQDCVTGNCEEEEGGEYAPGEMPELEEADDVGDATSAYYARIRNAPIVQAVTSISVPTGGTCPAGVAQTFFGPISFDSFCELAPQVLAGLVWLFRAIWAWAAIRLFFTA